MVLRVCKNYYSQVWYEALSQAGVEASPALRRAESIYYPPAIREFVRSNSRTDIASKVAEVGKDGTAKVPTSFDAPSEVVE